MATKFYRIAKDEWEAGSHQNCAKCGARIRNVVEIDGHAHGADCAASILGWKGTKAQLNKKVEEIVKRLAYASKVASVANAHPGAIGNAAVMCEEALQMTKRYSSDLYRLRCRNEAEFVKATLAELSN